VCGAFAEFSSGAQTQLTSDIHCAPNGSRYDSPSGRAPTRELLAAASHASTRARGAALRRRYPPIASLEDFAAETPCSRIAGPSRGGRRAWRPGALLVPISMSGKREMAAGDRVPGGWNSPGDWKAALSEPRRPLPSRAMPINSSPSPPGRGHGDTAAVRKIPVRRRRLPSLRRRSSA